MEGDELHSLNKARRPTAGGCEARNVCGATARGCTIHNTCGTAQGSIKGTDMSEIDRLKTIVEKLRAEDGCPWDRAQTHESLKPACIEEAAEVIGGINILTKTGKAGNLREELGDLLLQVVFHAVIAEEEGLFTLEDVARTVSDKMVRRHPHVFAGAKYSSDEDRHAAWERIKKAEKEGREWQETYLAVAMEEAKELIDVAERRKGYR